MRPRNFIEILRYRASVQPDETLYTFLVDGEKLEQTITYRALEEKALAIAARLQAMGMEGERALLLHLPGLEFIAAFFGCLYAGVVAVPAYPPQRERNLDRLLALIADARIALCLTESPIFGAIKSVAATHPALGGLPWIPTDQIPVEEGSAWRAPDISGDHIAFLQYTSGSTSDPKGVMVSHGNLLHNQAVIEAAYGHSEKTIGVGWLPFYHDMGLIGKVLQPLYLGIHCVLMSPISFLQKPLRWLQAITRYRGTTSVSPNFGYDLCVAKITPEQIATLDLSSWQVAGNGAEPVRADTIERFSRTFAPCGFRRDAFYPCYGLAEATLLVAGGHSAKPPVIMEVDAGALERGRVAAPGATSRRLVGCGNPWLDHEVVIVAPETRRLVNGGEIGEIWVAGPSVARGYWNRPELSREVFQARLAREADHAHGDAVEADSRTYLRTGDVGFIAGGELFVTGRRKDLIIIRGRNHYPQDIEHTVALHPAVRSGGVIAFAIEEHEEERLVIVCEISRVALAGFPAKAQETGEAIVAAVSEQHELHTHAIVFLRPGDLPKTSSGKVQRQRCKAMYEESALVALGVWQGAPHGLPAEPAAEIAGGGGASLPRAPDVAVDAASHGEAISTWIARWLSRKLGTGAIDHHKPLVRYGIDSILAVELSQSLQEEFGVTVAALAAWDYPTVSALAAHVAEHLAARDMDGHAVPSLPGEPSPAICGDSGMALSANQAAFWYIYRSAPQSAAYNAAFAMRIHGACSAGVLRQAVQYLVDRHPMLRTTYGNRDSEPVQVIREHQEAFFQLIEASGWDEEVFEQRVTETYKQPFDLRRGPVCRAHLFVRSDHAVLLFNVHHIACDAWSMNRMLDELFAAYAALSAGVAPALPPPGSSYQDFVREQKDSLERGALAGQRAYWAGALAGDLPFLELATDRPRPTHQSDHGSTHRFAFTKEQTRALREFARDRGTTVYAVLLAAFHALLHRYTGQRDILVGVPTFARNLVKHKDVVGNFINTIVVRGDVRGDSSFAGLLATIQDTLRAGLANMEYPFALLVDHLSVKRDSSRHPVFQVIFNFQRLKDTDHPDPDGKLGLLEALLWGDGRGDAPVAWGPLTVSRFPMEQEEGQFELALDIAEGRHVLHGALKYNTDLFAAATIARMVAHYVTMVDSAVAEPDAPIARLPMLAAGERQAILAGFGNGSRFAPGDAGVVELFAAQAEKTPDRVAVVCEGRRLRYGELERRANQLAHWLATEYQVRPGDAVAVAMGRSERRIVALLGVLKAGAVYVPIEPGHPAERNGFILADAGAGVVLTDSGVLSGHEESACKRAELMDLSVLSAYPADNPGRMDDAATAYIIYTSGSTGEPKGVRVTGRNLKHTLLGAQRAFGFDAATVMPLLASHVFDISLFEMFCPLLAGGSCVMVTEDALLQPRQLREVLQEVTAIHGVPSLMKELARIARDSGRSHRHVKQVFTGGDQVPHALLGELQDVFGQAEIHELYGPTEGTIICSSYHYDGAFAADNKNIIGTPLPSVTLYILDEHLTPVPVGVPGEICIAGGGVARGYTRAELDANKFIDDPIAGTGRLYRTGDRGRWLATGAIEFLGRRDEQVKIRGHRIELGEIENVLQKHPEVAAAVVVADGDEGGRCLVAHVVMAAGDWDSDAERLRSHIRQHLPEYMIPAYFVRLDRLPLNANGKVDRKALPPFNRAELAPDHDYAPPQTPVETVLAEIWAQVLQREQVGVHDDFFALGGHSLLALQVTSRLQAALGIELPVRALFEDRTVAALAARVKAMGRDGREVSSAAPPLVKRSSTGPGELSFAQQRLWFLDQLEPGSPLYNIPVAARLRGRLHPDALRAGLERVVERHDALRTAFVDAGGIPRQLVSATAQVPFEVIRLDPWPPHEREPEALRRAALEARRPFALELGGLIRAVLFVLGDEDHLLVVTLHHIVADGWSVAVLLRELRAAYEALAAGDEPALPPLPVQYVDYSVWQRRWLDQGLRAAELAYWTRQLGDAPPALELALDRPRPRIKQTAGANHALVIPVELMAAVDALAKRAGVTRFMVLFGGFALLLGRYAGVTDVCVGTPVAGRSRVELEGLIGFFANTLVLRADLAGNPTVLEYLARIRDMTLGAYEHQHLPFEEVVEALAPPRDQSRTPLFQVMFALDNAPRPALALGDIALEPVYLDAGVSKFDLTLSLSSDGQALRGIMEYDTGLFEAATIARMDAQLACLLASMTSGPETRLFELDFLPAPERERVLVEWNGTARPLDSAAFLHERIAAHAARTPDAVAVEEAGGTITYGELNRRSDALAHRLRALGVDAEVPVAVYTERSIATMIGLVSILKAGGAYLPLDPSYPQERLSFMLADAQAPVALVQSHLPALPAAVHAVFLEEVVAGLGAAAGDPSTGPGAGITPEQTAIRDDQLAYIIYTSGSTGVPKGTLIEHRGLRNLIEAETRLFDIGPGCRVAQLTSLGFDVSMAEISMALGSGATLCIPPRAARLPGPEQLAWLRDRDIHLMALTPSALAALPFAPLPALRTIVAAGEACPADLVTRWAPGRRFFNAYGPTEASVYTTIMECKPGEERPPIGRPLDNVQVYVLGPGLGPQPIGVAGELCISGTGLGRCYLHRPALSAERFIPSPFARAPGERLYTTGDVVRWRADGVLEYLGRRDDQVKIRGHRIELGEVQAALQTHPAMREAVVVAQNGPGGHLGLVAYVVRRAPEKQDISMDIRTYLRSKLPEPMVPWVVVELDALPLTPSGKVDRRALPAPDARGRNGTQAYAPPGTPIEEALCAIVGDVLNGPVGVHDDFFALGGHSLLAAQVVSRIRERFAIELPLRALFEQSTVAGLAGVVEGRLGAGIAAKSAVGRMSRSLADDVSEKPSEGRTDELEEGEL